MTSLEQSVLQGTQRQVQGYNGSNSAQFRRPWSATQTFPFEHNRVKHLCSGGHVTCTETWGSARVPRVDPREDMIRLLCEKGSDNKRMPGKEFVYDGGETVTGMGSTFYTTNKRHRHYQFPRARCQSEELYSIEAYTKEVKVFSLSQAMRRRRQTDQCKR